MERRALAVRADVPHVAARGAETAISRCPGLFFSIRRRCAAARLPACTSIGPEWPAGFRLIEKASPMRMFLFSLHTIRASLRVSPPEGTLIIIARSVPRVCGPEYPAGAQNS